MNREDIIRMAREAGMTVVDDEYSLLPFLERFFHAAYAAGAAAEREACAKVCDEWTRTPATTGMELTLAAAAIRARGQA